MIPFGQLASQISGRLDTGDSLRQLYATDASEYQELPAGVVFPESEEDLRETARKLLFVHGVRFAALLGIGGGSFSAQTRAASWP